MKNCLLEVLYFIKEGLLHIQGKIDFFQGVEEIYYQTYKVYEGFIQGGIVK